MLCESGRLHYLTYGSDALPSAVPLTNLLGVLAANAQPVEVSRVQGATESLRIARRSDGVQLAATKAVTDIWNIGSDIFFMKTVRLKTRLHAHNNWHAQGKGPRTRLKCQCVTYACKAYLGTNVINK